jgi:hypothetical protein
MNDPENFVSRWSRLKRESAKEQTNPAQPALPANEKPGADRIRVDTDRPAAVSAEPSAPFDESSLPPIESITAGTDIRAFLQKNVPAHLTRAALRRAWTTDPAIRDFIGIAENQWDFTDPAAMPGFGPLTPTDDVARLVAQAMGKLGDVGEPATGGVLPTEEHAPAATAALAQHDASPRTQAIGMPEEMKASAEQSRIVEAEHCKENAATQHAIASAETVPDRSRRSHGSALPK